MSLSSISRTDNICVAGVVAHNDTNQPYDGLFSSDLSALESCNIHPTFELLHMVNLAVEQVAKSKDDRIVVTPGLFTKASESLENLTKIFKPQIRSRAIVYLNALVSIGQYFCHL